MFAIFAASYLRLAQRYWQTFLIALALLCSGVIFSAAWVAYKTEQSFDLEKWVLILLLALAISTLIPFRFFNAVGVAVYTAALTYLFLILTHQPLRSTASIQAEVAVVLFIVSAVAYFRERQLWAFFQSTSNEAGS